MLVGIFVMLRIPDAVLFYYSFDPTYPVPAIRGHVMVSVIWTLVFMTALWIRRIWARYLLVLFLGYMAFAFSIAVSMIILAEQVRMGPAITVAGAFVAYFSATMILIFSRDIGRLANRM